MVETTLPNGLETSGQRSYRYFWYISRCFWVFAFLMIFSVFQKIGFLGILGPPYCALWRCYKGEGLLLWCSCNDMWQVTCDRWHMTCDTWHIMDDTLHMTYDTWHVTPDTRTHGTWLLGGLGALPFALSDMGQVTGELWHVTHDTWHMTFDMWHVTHDTWHMIHDTFEWPFLC